METRRMHDPRWFRNRSGVRMCEAQRFAMGSLGRSKNRRRRNAMHTSHFICRSFLTLSLLTLSLCVIAVGVQAQGQATQQPFELKVGQAGKDVVWVPTSQALVDKMLDMAKVTAQDYVIDLGSGDGRTVITAARRAPRALGIEYNPGMGELSRRNAV